MFLSIIASRFATKIGNRLVLFAIVYKTAVESHQNMDGSERGIVKHFRSMMSNFTARTAAESSSLGMVIPFSGVRRDFPTTKAQRTEPCSSTIQRYEHAEYAFWEASEK